MSQQAQAEQNSQEQLGQLEAIAKRYLDQDALTRLGTIKAADPEKAAQIVLVIAQLLQQGRLRGVLSDEKFKQLLTQISPQKREIKITRK